MILSIKQGLDLQTPGEVFRLNFFSVRSMRALVDIAIA